MNEKITEEGICETCGRKLADFEVYHQICVDCGGYPICQNCSGNGCAQCNWIGEIRPKKQ